jgi:mycothiol S-conjugate amidase
MTSEHESRKPDDLDRLCLVTIHAHPDDEASKGAPTVAKYVNEGVRSVLVCCTGGEEGDLHNPTLRAEGQPFHGLTPDEERVRVASMRAEELARSAEAIGFHDVVMLGYRDSGMPDSEANTHPDSFHQADLDEATGRLVEVLRRERPQVLITYGDDQRGYPHPDHLKVHDVSVLAFERSGDPAWYPDAGPPWTVSKMYYSVWSKARLLAVHEALLRLRGSSPYDDKWLSRPDHDHRITTRIDVRPFLGVRTQALLAHATQVNPEEPWWFGLSDEEMEEVWPWEDWILAVSHVGPTAFETHETDLFTGVRRHEPAAVGN